MPNGKVLVVSSRDREIYDPASGTWALAAAWNDDRICHTATLLPGGRLLLAGGLGSSGPLASAEIYDSAIGGWGTTNALTTARSAHTATLLTNGVVLVAGGLNTTNSLSTAELYSGHWNLDRNLPADHPTLLPLRDSSPQWQGLGYGWVDGTNSTSSASVRPCHCDLVADRLADHCPTVAYCHPAAQW